MKDDVGSIDGKDKMSAPQPPVGREAEAGAVLRPTSAAIRGGVPIVRRRGTTMGSRAITGKGKEAVYPMFLDLARACADIDTFWQRFFDTMAMGRFPKGVILRDDCLVHRSRKKTSTFELTEEAKSDWSLVADFFRDFCDIRSERDWEERKKTDVVVQLTTAQINKRVKKEHANAIPEFTLVLKNRYDLTPAEMSEIDVMLRYYSNSNRFRPGDVVYNPSGAIKEIKTLVFDEERRQFSIIAEAKEARDSTKEAYQDPVSFLSAVSFMRPSERKIGFDDELRKQLRQLYAPQIAAREKVAPTPKPTRKPRGKKAAVVLAPEEPVIIEDDPELEIVTEAVVRSRHRSDDDSA